MGLHGESIYANNGLVGLIISLTHHGWLKLPWTLLSQGTSEIKEDAAVTFAQSLVQHIESDALHDLFLCKFHTYHFSDCCVLI